MILQQLASETFSSGDKPFDPTEIDAMINRAEESARTSLKDYYTEKTDREVEDLRNKMSDIRQQSARYIEGEQKSYAEKLQDSKASLRARGLTFSGVGTRQLGQQSAVEKATDAER